LKSQEVVMLKRTVARLLMFGIPFCLSYALTRPAAPVTPSQTFVVCSYGDQGREITLATEEAGCTKGKAQPSSWIVPAVGQPQQGSHSPMPMSTDATNGILSF
jgi:hypothetical protein